MTPLPILQSLASQLSHLTAVFDSGQPTNVQKSRFFAAIKRTIDHSLNTLEGYTHLKKGWEQLVRLNAEASSETKKMAPTWAHALLDTVKEVLQSISCRKGPAHAFFQRKDVRELLLQSLSQGARRQQKELPHTFQAAETLVSHLLQGQYGDAIRERILDSGFFTQEHFFLLLLVDIIREKGDLAAVERFRDIPSSVLDTLACTTLDNGDILDYLSLDGTLLPQEHQLFMHVSSHAHFTDEKTFSYLREYLLLQYAPCLDNLLYLVLHAKGNKILQELEPWVDARLHAKLAEMYSLVTCEDRQELFTTLSQKVGCIENEELQQEHVHTVITHIAEDRAQLAIDLARCFLDGNELEYLLRTIVFTYAKRHYEDAIELLPCVPEEYQTDLLRDIALFYAEHDPKRAFSIVEELNHPDDSIAIFFAIIEHHGASVAMAFLELSPEGSREAFNAHMAMALADMETDDPAFITALSCLTDRKDLAICELLPFVQKFDANKQDILRQHVVAHIGLSDINLLRFARLWLLLERDMQTAFDILQLVFDPDLRAAGFSSAIVELCWVGKFDQRAANLVRSYFVKDLDLEQLALDTALQMIERLVAISLESEITKKESGSPIPETPLTSLARCVGHLLVLTQRSAHRGRCAHKRQLARLAAIYAPFSSITSLQLLRDAQLEEPDAITRATHAVSLGYFSECNSERGSIEAIFNWIGMLRKAHVGNFDPLLKRLRNLTSLT